LKKRDYYN